MNRGKSGVVPLLTGLSARLLILTIFFIMLTEVLIYAPSIGRYRLVYMEERIAAAHLASLALEAPPDNRVSAPLMQELLDHSRSHGIVLRRRTSKALMLTQDMPPQVAAAYDLRQRRFFPLIWEAFGVLARDGNRIVRVIAPSPRDPGVLVETIIDEAPMRAEMLDYSKRILLLSVVISLITGALVYVSLHLLFVRPMVRITQAMEEFRANPDDAGRVVTPGRRRDEIGRAERELADLQSGLRAALQQRARLAALGTAMTKIHHDLRNILATVQLVSDHVSDSDDPKVRRVAPTLFGAIDRAVKLCSQTLRYAGDETPVPQPTRFDLSAVVDEIGVEIVEFQAREVDLVNRVAAPFAIDADRDQVFRALSNIVMNACQAKAATVVVRAARDGSGITIDVADDGPGIPPPVRERLFQPFAGSGRAGGTGLGLVIARDLMRGHGGDVELTETGDTGTVFRLSLPDREAEREEAAPPPHEASAQA